ncbi:MAG: glycogen/starch/alpha-glucan phosphorylase [Deltaproteobacteria bacterium]|nr:glycogen/starch/alpha-glucan phosphorylase [Deltaproteobacteria bacterium]
MENRQKSQGKERPRTGTSPETLAQAILDNLYYIRGCPPELATKNDWYMALAHTVRDRLLDKWVQTLKHLKEDIKVVSYLSAEFLLGPQLGNHLINLGIWEQIKEGVSRNGLKLEDLLGQEGEPGLGNGGLGRLAACYLDSLATLDVPAIGYGIRYEFGIFDQEIRDGWQVEVSDKWLEMGNPWEICKPEIAYRVGWKGRTEIYLDTNGQEQRRWLPDRMVKGVAHDYPVSGYRNRITGLLRLWKAEAVKSFDFADFNVGDYYGAVEEKVVSETVTKVLYPNDEPAVGKMLRLAQQHFFVSCSLQDMIHIHLLRGKDLDSFHESFAVQLNDTHPAIAVAELMRLLVDEHYLPWEQAWEITRHTMAYTNHTLLPEALETWPQAFFAEHLPRHLEIIYEINQRFLDEVRLKFPRNEEKVRRLSLIDETGGKSVRMANLASVGSHAINGVAALHTELLKQTVLKDFYDLWPEKFLNVTNGVTPRRFLALSNPGLSGLITDKIGPGWVKNLEQLRRLEEFAEDPEFHRDWLRVKLANKQALAADIRERTGVVVNPESLFDIQVKRIHEYKRQHLNVLHIITLFNRLKSHQEQNITPRTFIFGGKAAPGYLMAKLIIKLINSVAEVMNSDPDLKDRLKVVFSPNFNVKNGQLIYPAADLSEQISTAGKEASGTGNMKFAMNGALTIGTLDGANVEIREEVGPENFFLFGLTAEEAQNLRRGGYNPQRYYHEDDELREALDLINSGFFSHGDRDLFKPLVDSLLYHDDYLLLADYRSYVDRQDEVGYIFRDEKRWTRMSILNAARMGKFSSDRAIREYCEKVWGVRPL